MNNDEYRQYLDALARKHLRKLDRYRLDPIRCEKMGYELERLSRLKRLTLLASDNGDMDDDLIQVLAKNLIDSHRGYVHDMERSGVLDALDDDPSTIYQNLRRDAIPAEDVEFLRDAGCSDPEAELTIYIAYVRNHLHAPHINHEQSATTRVRNSPEALQDAGRRLRKSLDSKSKVLETSETKASSKRKILTGVGNILSGAILATGNILLGTGYVVAPNPGITFGVIGSCAVATGAICKGMGELRGE